MTEQQQDIDTGSGKVVNQGEPVKHVDMEHGQSIGHSAEPEAEAKPKPKAKPRKAEKPQPEPDELPQRISRDEIYAAARKRRQSDVEEGQQTMSQEDREHFARMEAESRGETWDESKAQAPREERQVSQQTDAQESTARQEPPQSSDPALDPNDETVSIIIYGMREEVPRSEVEAAGGIEAYQKNRAADEKLRRLTTYEASIRDLDRQVTERAERLRRSPPAQQLSTGEADPSPTDDPNSADEKELAAEIVKGFYSGDEEQAIEKLSSAFSRLKSSASTGATRPTSPEPPAAQFEHQQPPRPQNQGPSVQQMQEANAVFANEFGDLQTPVLRSAVLAMVNEVQREPLMRGRPLAEVTREAAMRVRNDVGTVRPQSQSDPSVSSRVPTDLGERMNLKSRTVVAPLHQASQRAPSGEQSEAQFPSNSEYIQQMKVRRNQA